MFEDGMINIMWDKKELQEDVYLEGNEVRQMMSKHVGMAIGQELQTSSRTTTFQSSIRRKPKSMYFL
jgi:hypothetical protein